MAVWSKNKVESSAINGGNEYEKKDRLSREQLNAITNNSFYATNTADEAKRIAENVEAGTNYPVSYNAQVLLEEQKAQARKNIGVVSQSQTNSISVCPSDNRINLSVENGVFFQATYTGYVVAEGNVATVGDNTGLLRMTTSSDGTLSAGKLLDTYVKPGAKGACILTLPVKKGQYIRVQWGTSTTLNYVHFIMAQEV